MNSGNDSFYQDDEPGGRQDENMSVETAIKFGLQTGADFAFRWTEWHGSDGNIEQGWSFNYPPACPGRHEKSLWRVCHNVITYDLDEIRKEQALQ